MPEGSCEGILKGMAVASRRHVDAKAAARCCSAAAPSWSETIKAQILEESLTTSAPMLTPERHELREPLYRDGHVAERFRNHLQSRAMHAHKFTSPQVTKDARGVLVAASGLPQGAAGLHRSLAAQARARAGHRRLRPQRDASGARLPRSRRALHRLATLHALLQESWSKPDVVAKAIDNRPRSSTRRRWTQRFP